MLLEKELSGFGIRLIVTPGFGIFMQKWGVGVGGGGWWRDSGLKEYTGWGTPKITIGITPIEGKFGSGDGIKEPH